MPSAGDKPMTDREWDELRERLIRLRDDMRRQGYDTRARLDTLADAVNALSDAEALASRLERAEGVLRRIANDECYAPPDPPNSPPPPHSAGLGGSQCGCYADSGIYEVFCEKHGPHNAARSYFDSPPDTRGSGTARSAPKEEE